MEQAVPRASERSSQRLSRRTRGAGFSQPGRDESLTSRNPPRRFGGPLDYGLSHSLRSGEGFAEEQRTIGPADERRSTQIDGVVFICVYLRSSAANGLLAAHRELNPISTASGVRRLVSTLVFRVDRARRHQCLMPHSFCHSNKTGADFPAAAPPATSKSPSRRTENGRKTRSWDAGCNAIDTDFEYSSFALQKVCGLGYGCVRHVGCHPNLRGSGCFRLTCVVSYLL